MSGGPSNRNNARWQERDRIVIEKMTTLANQQGARTLLLADIENMSEAMERPLPLVMPMLGSTFITEFKDSICECQARLSH